MMEHHPWLQVHNAEVWLFYKLEKKKTHTQNEEVTNEKKSKHIKKSTVHGAHWTLAGAFWSKINKTVITNKAFREINICWGAFIALPKTERVTLTYLLCVCSKLRVSHFELLQMSREQTHTHTIAHWNRVSESTKPAAKTLTELKRKDRTKTTAFDLTGVVSS